MGHRLAGDVRPVVYSPPQGASGEIELASLERIRVRGGPNEFLTPQRLGFDLLIRIDSGTTVHTVDFTGYLLEPGDLLWVRAGQVQQWGDIDAIDGPVFLFTPSFIDDAADELIRQAGVVKPNHWPAMDFANSAASSAFTAATAATTTTALGATATARLLAATLLLLVDHSPSGSALAHPATHEAFIWFRDEVESYFRTRRKVTEYAAHLGYSTRTLNRLARENTGMSAKQLIDERILLEAKRLLAHSPNPAARIAEHLGFDDPSNFAKYFLHRTGITPAEFRAHVRDTSTGPLTDRTPDHG